MAPWVLDSLKDGKMALAMPGNVPLQQISTESIGEFVRAVVERREGVFGSRFDIASDELDANAAAAAVSSDAQKAIVYEGFPPAYMREQNEDFAIMFEWFVSDGYTVDIPDLKANFPDVSWPTFSEWSSNQDWKAAGL